MPVAEAIVPRERRFISPDEMETWGDVPAIAVNLAFNEYFYLEMESYSRMQDSCQCKEEICNIVKSMNLCLPNTSRSIYI